MHPSALDGFRRMISDPVLAGDMHGRVPRVLDVGGADVNGTVHPEIRRVGDPGAVIDVVDVEEGPGVTIVGDASTLKFWLDIETAIAGNPSLTVPPTMPPYDLVISTETLEHVENWEMIVRGAHAALRSGGWFVGTCASVGRRPHGARGEHDPGPEEWYENVDPTYLIYELLGCFRGGVVVEYSRLPEYPTTNDLYWRARKQ